jgi:GT2 family glycosyltransferase
MPTDFGRVTAVIVCYNSSASLEACVTSLLADPSRPGRVVIVDNASSDASLALARRLAANHAGLSVIANRRNRGYAGGVNSALPEARGDYLAVLNPDCVVRPGWLAPVYQALDEDPQVMAANPLLVLAHDPGQINAAGQDVHVTALGFNRLLHRPLEAAGTEVHPVSGLHGGAVLLRRSLLDALGGWDETGFLYHEDVELSWSAQLLGGRLVCAPQAQVLHDYHLSMHPDKLFLLERNRAGLLHSHLGADTRRRLAPLLAATEIMMWAYCALRGPDFVRAKARAVAWAKTAPARLAGRTDRIRRLRQISDADLLRRLHWNYAWDQFVTLGRERGPGRRAQGMVA